MRKTFEQQLRVGVIAIPEVEIPLNSRDELPPVLAGLQHIFITPELNQQVFEILEHKISGDKKRTGRPGMSLWEILVLGVVRMARDCNFDELLSQANYHKLVRGIMGVEEPYVQGKQYKLQTLRDNVCLLDAETINQISELVVGAGHRIVKKKEGQSLAVKADTYVLETNVHFPTDLNLLWDSARKCMDVLDASRKNFKLIGWRKGHYWRKECKKLFRVAERTTSGGGKNKAERLKKNVGAYLAFCGKLDQKVTLLKNQLQSEGIGSLMLAHLLALDYYHQMLKKHIGQSERRLIKGETIPHAEKVFSIFEDHTELIKRGKAGRGIELGHKIALATDQFHFILYHEVLEGVSDYQLPVPLAKELVCRYADIASLSFDKGGYSKENIAALKNIIPQVIIPKRGRLTEEEKQAESHKKFKQLRNQHSAIESNINQLECNGLNRCPDKGKKAFKRYAALGVLSYNLHRLGTNLIAAERKKAEKEKRKAA